AIQIFDAGTPPANAGFRTSSLARPISVVSPIDASANSSAPTSDTRKGAGCMRMYEPTKRIPRQNRPCSIGWSSCRCMELPLAAAQASYGLQRVVRRPNAGYRESVGCAVQSPPAGHALQVVLPGIVERESRPRDQVFHGLGDENLR